MRTSKKYSNFNRILAFFLSVVLLLMQLPVGALAVDTPVVETVVSTGELEIGNSVLIEEETLLAFTPKTSGVYCFYSTSGGGHDPKIRLLDADKKQLAQDDDSGEGLNFELHYELTAGITYYVEASAYSNKYPYTLTVEESDVLSIEIVSIPTIEMEEYDMRWGNWQTVYQNEIVDRYFQYYPYQALYEAVIKVNYKDGTSEELAFYNENEERTGISMDWDFCHNPWTVGSDNHYYVTYKGLKALANATVVESPVTQIEVVSVENTQFVEMDESAGYWSNYYSGLELDEQYFVYAIEEATRTIKLLVTYADGSTEELTTYDEKGESAGIYIYSDQYRYPWSVGENEFEIWYRGVCTTAAATVLESPVESIRVISTDHFAYTEGDENYGYWTGDDSFYYDTSRFMQDVVLEVTYKDGTTAEVAAASDWAVRGHDDQYKIPWTVNGDNELRITYKGAETTVHVTIKPSLVESIFVENVVVTEGTNGSWWGQELPNGSNDMWYHYEIYAADITVHLTDGTTLRGDQEYIWQQLGTNVSLNPQNNQHYESPWGVGEYAITASLMGKKTEFLFVIVESEISSISVEDVELEEKQDGHWRDGYYVYGDWIEEEWFCYMPHYAANITVTFKDGTVFTGTADQFDMQYGMRPQIVDDQSGQNQWQAGGVYTAKVYLGGKSAEFSVTIGESNITGIEVIDTQGFVYYENDTSCGEWRGDYFYYSAWYLASRVTIRVTYKDGTTEDIPYYDQYGNYSGISYSDKQGEAPWTVGGENLLTITYGGAKTTISATIQQSPITSIVVDKITHTQYTNGHWNMGGYWDDYGNWVNTGEYYHYDVYPQNITITFTDGRVISGDPDEIEKLTGIRPEFGAVQDWDAPWGIGEHTATLTFMGASVEYIVAIEESNIVSIVVDRITYTQHTNGGWHEGGYWDENDNWVSTGEYYHYNIYPQNITITYKDGTIISGAPDEIEKLTGICPEFSSDQNGNSQWGVGEHTAFLIFMGTRVEYIVAIEESNIAGITASDITYIEGTGGWWNDYYENDSLAGQYYYYRCYPEVFTITYKDGTSITGTREEIGLQTGYYPDVMAEQGPDNQWGVGTYTATISYMGAMGEFQIIIEPSPVASIAVESVTCIEYTNGDWQYHYTDEGEQRYFYYYINPDKMTVTYTDGTTITGYPYEIRQQTGYEVSLLHNQDYYNQWGVGIHTVTVSFMGKTAEFTVEIVASPIVSITVDPLYLEEGTNGYWSRNEYGEYNFYYYFSPQSITVEFTDGTQFTGTYDELNEQVEGQLSFGAMQGDGSWGVGTHTATLTCMGTSVEYDIVITPTRIESITVLPIIAVAGKDGWLNSEYYDENIHTWNPGEWYEYNIYPEMMIVTFKDGSVFTGNHEDLDILGFDVRYVHDQSYDNPWGTGVHSVTLLGVGFETSYVVEIQEQVETEDFSYVVLSDGTAALVGYHGSSYDLIVPETIDGYTVTVVTSYFIQYSGIESLTIPATVRYVENYAFAWNYSLKTVRIYAGIEMVGQRAFTGCESLEKVLFFGTAQEAENILIFENNDELENTQWRYVGECTEHEYEDACDAECDICGEVREPEHEFTWVVDCEASCVEDGWKHEWCPLCGIARNFGTVIPAKGEHTNTELRDERPATCSQSGYTGDLYCNDCQQYVSYGQSIDPTDHLNTEIHDARPATCGQWGHTGNVYCNDCYSYIEMGTPIEPTGQHQNTGIVNETEANCQHEGYTGDVYCYDCGNILALGETIPMKDHEDTVIINQREATCGQNGYTGDLYCNDCGQIVEYGEEIVASDGHMNTVLQNQYDATCGDVGYTGDLFCMDCQTVVANGQVIPATGEHGALTVENAYAPTCNAPGYTGNVFCKDCQKVVQYGQEIPATNKHVYDNGYDADCNECGAVREVTLQPAVLSLSGGTAYQGETIRIDIRIDGNTGFAALQLGVLFDNAYLTLKSVETQMEDFFVTVDKSIVMDSFKNHTADGVIATLVFEVAQDAPVGDYHVQLRFMSGSNEDFEEVVMTDSAVTIKVESAVAGDANGDGKVNTSDLVMIRKYLAYMDPVTMTSDVEVKKGADTNGDGVIDAIDLAFVRQYLASMSAS